MQQTWDSVDAYLEGVLLDKDPLLEWVIKEQSARGLPAIQVTPLEGKLLQIIAQAMRAKHVLEIGTLGGYSTILLARALPADGQVITLEVDPKHADLANAAFERAGLDEKIDLRLGAALDSLPMLSAEGQKFDFVFIDADKASYGDYVRWAIPRLRKGGLLLADNAYIWGGMHYYGRDPSEVPFRGGTGLFDFGPQEFRGMSECWKELEMHPEFASIILPTGEGLAVAVKS